MTTQQRNAAMVNLLRADFQARYEPQFALANYMATVLALPGLRGFWPMSAYDASGNAIDISANIHTLGAGTGRTLTYNGNPTYNYDDLAPYIDLDGTGDFLSRLDEAGLDITGTETYVANPGLTLGGWFYFDDISVTRVALSKFNISGGINQRAYLLQRQNTNVARFLVSTDGTAQTTVDHTDTISAQTWHFIVGRFTPSTELAVFDNGTEVTNTTSIPASIFNSAASFEVGSHSGGTSGLLAGQVSLCFLCAAALSNSIVTNLFQQSRALFGV